MIAFKCASCGKDYKLPDNTAGRKARCKACGEAMVVPDAPDDLFDDSPPAGDDLTALYASKEPTDVIDQSEAMSDPLAFNPEVAFQRSDKPSAVPPLPMKLIIGAGAGFLGLIVIIVVVVIVVSGGGEKDQDANAGALAFDADGAFSAGDRPSPRPTPSPVTPEPTTPDTTDEPEGTDPVTDVEPTDPTTPTTTEVSPSDPETDDEPEAPVQPKPKPNRPDNLLAPTSAAYAIMLPGDLEVVSQTRVAIRTSPHEDGTWLSMEVHKLAGLDRREATPVSADNRTVLLRGRRIAMPAGVEVSEIVNDQYTIKRLLYPLQTGAEVRRVEYVIKDGPYLISVLGRYPVKDEARLLMLDDAAQSVQPLEDE